MSSLVSNLDKIPVSYPIRVNFAGFESDTLRLQNAGWQLSMESFAQMARYGYTTRLAMKHEAARLYAISGEIQLDRDFLAATAFGNFENLVRFYKEVQFHIVCVAPEIKFQIHASNHLPSFAAVDATPQMVDRKIFGLDQIGMFKPIALSDEAQIYVPEHSVAELLEIIKAKQEPMQKEIRDRRRSEKLREDVRARLSDEVDGYEPQRDIKAQILSIAV